MSRYDLIIGGGCPPERREALRRLSPKVRFVSYANAIDCVLPEGIDGVERIDTGHAPHSSPLAETVWRKHRDYLLANRLAAREPSADPRRIYAWGYQKPYDRSSRHANRFFLDPRSGWRRLYADHCAEGLTEGYDGVFADNAGPKIEWLFAGSPEHLRPPVRNVEWAAAVAEMLAGARRRLRKDRPEALVYANTCGGFLRSDIGIAPSAFWRAAEIDGAMDEFFAHAERGEGKENYQPMAVWTQQVRAILCCEKLGRAYLAQANGREDDHDARVFALASFLIGAGEHSMFNYNPAAAATYPLVYRLPEWDLDLGEPETQYESLDEALKAGGGDAYVRLFSAGAAAVNISDRPVTLDLERPCRQVTLEGGTIAHGGKTSTGPAAKKLELPPRSAAILLA